MSTLNLGHGEHEGPIYNPQRPPWIGLWSSREYHGRPDWWKEAGLKDELVRSGRWRSIGTKTREEDPDCWDPRVPDGTSLQGPFGIDSSKVKNLTMKGDTPGELDKFQEKVMKGTHQYKAIAEKWNLSKEHPGLAVSPNLDSLVLTPPHKLGTGMIYPSSWFYLGPRFFDKPLSTAPHEKAFAAAKYAGIAMMPWTMLHLRAFPPSEPIDFKPRMYVKRYFKLATLPIVLAGTWGFTLSFSAAIRDKDDIYNQYYAAAVTAFTFGHFKHNLSLGITFFFVASLLGTFYHYARVSESGLQNRLGPNNFGGHWGGPQVWKFFQQGSQPVPEKNF